MSTLKCVKASRSLSISFPELRDIEEVRHGSLEKNAIIKNQKACEFLRKNNQVALNQESASKHKPFYEVEIEVSEEEAEDAENEEIDVQPDGEGTEDLINLAEKNGTARKKETYKR